MATMNIAELVTQLRAAHDGALRAAVLYGSAAGGDHHEKHSDQNVLVIVRALSLNAMSAAGAIARSWGEAGNPPPLTLTEAEWRSSVDVFAMEHADIIDRHKVLYAEPGYDFLLNMPIAREDIRRQLEYEAMGTLLAVRSGIFLSDGSQKDRVALLENSMRRVLALFRATLRLTGIKPGADNTAVCTQAGERAGFDAEPFVAVVAHRRGETKLAGERTATVLAGYHAGLERLVAFLDGLPSAN